MMELQGLVHFEALQAFTKRKRPADVIRWLNERRVRWTTDGQGRPCTTLRQIDQALEQDAGGFEFDGAGGQ